ncbi:unnamed protein product [Cuscuta europaea]|uniref:Uncharacterized protein n=1 Tax=Cuscuta europaea TaxID=41803 RepID=A0A9P1ENA2_CUSEU|nr:unnamed protein product [Cuscuta europaea]
MGHDVCLTRSLQKGQLGVNPRLSQSVDRFLQITRDFNGSLLEGGLVACSGKPKAWSRSPSEFRGMACPTPTPFWNAASVLSMRVVVFHRGLVGLRTWTSWLQCLVLESIEERIVLHFSQTQQLERACPLEPFSNFSS